MTIWQSVLGSVPWSKEGTLLLWAVWSSFENSSRIKRMHFKDFQVDHSWKNLRPSYSYGFDWHAIKHWTPFTHSPPFIHCYCSQYEESQITPFCCHTGPRLSSLSTLHTTSNNFTSSPFVCKERCETICSQDREGQLWSKLMWDNDIQRRAQCRTSERHCVVLEIHPGCEYLTDRGRLNQHLP